MCILNGWPLIQRLQWHGRRERLGRRQTSVCTSDYTDQLYSVTLVDCRGLGKDRDGESVCCRGGREGDGGREGGREKGKEREREGG